MAIWEIYSIENLITEGTVAEKNHKMERYLRSSMRKERYGSECIKMDMANFHKLKHDDKIEFARSLCQRLNENYRMRMIMAKSAKVSVKVGI